MFVASAQPRINEAPVNNPAMDSSAQDTQDAAVVAALGNKVVVAYNDTGSALGGANHFTGFASSSNTGSSFTDHGALPPSSLGDVGDPALARDNATGAFYLTTLAYSAAGVQFFKSTNGGQSFLPPVLATPGVPSNDRTDKPWVTVDNFAGTGQHTIYVCDTDLSFQWVEFYRSTDQGATFGPNGGTVIASAGAGICFVAVGPDHSVYVFYLRNQGNNRLFVRRSTDLGVSFGAEHQVANLLTTSGNGDLALKGGFRSNSGPQVAVNPVSGDIVVAFNDDLTPGSSVDNGDVFYVRSTDEGVTWSAPVRVNEVAAGDQFFPTVALTPNGQGIMFAWYDRSEDPSNLWFHRRARTGTMSTTNGSITLRHSFQLSPNTPVVVGQDPVLAGNYMGAYDQIDAANGAFHAVWADNRESDAAHAHQPDVRYAQIATSTADSDLAVTVTPTPGTISQGQTTTLTVRVSASGDVARDVFLNISPVTGLSFASASGACELDGQFVGCSLGSIAAGTSRTLTIAARGVTAGPRTVKVTGTTSSNDTAQGNNTATGTVTVKSIPGSTSSFSTGNILAPISDSSTVDVHLTVPNLGTVNTVQALVRLNHTFDADIDMFLIDPLGHTVELSTDNGGSDDNYGSGTADCAGTPTTFTDSAPSSIVTGIAPFAGAFAPEQPLFSLFGVASAGTWTLRVTDDSALDFGTIYCFKLQITHPP